MVSVFLFCIQLSWLHPQTFPLTHPGLSPYSPCPSISNVSPYGATELLQHLQSSNFFPQYSQVEYEIFRCLLTFIDFEYCKPIPELTKTRVEWGMLTDWLKHAKSWVWFQAQQPWKTGFWKKFRVALTGRGKRGCQTRNISSKFPIWSQTPKESSQRPQNPCESGFHQALILLNNLNLAGSFSKWSISIPHRCTRSLFSVLKVHGR